MFAVESIGQLILEISIISTGMAFAILGLVLAVSRSMTKNENHWALIFSSFSWLIALIIPNVWFAGMIFIFGAFSMMLSYMPILEKMGDTNIFALAIIVAIINASLLIGSGAFAVSVDWQTNLDSALNDIDNIVGTQMSSIGEGTPDVQLCTPNELDEDGNPCSNDITGGSFDENLFVPFASVLTIGTYIGKAVAFIGMVALAPLVLASTLTGTTYITNVIILYLMGFTIVLWQMGIFYKLVAFILDKRGLK